MRIFLGPSRARSGNTYLTILWIGLVAGIVLASYLKMVGTQNTFSMRSQAWNRAIAVTEAGIEEALTHLNKNGLTNFSNLARDGWWTLSDSYYMSRALDDAIYQVTISLDDTNPVIVARAYVPAVQNYACVNDGGPFLASFLETYRPRVENYLYRTVRVETTSDGLFVKGMMAKYWINMNGNNIRTDSFDSRDPAHSTNGFYYAPWAKDNGDVATTSGLTNFNNISVGNANIYGRVSTGPLGVVTTGPNGGVGSFAWQNAGNHGIQPGWFKDDMNVNFPPVAQPFSSGFFAPSGGNVGGTNYTYVLGTGKYKSASVTMSGQNKVLINGKAVWWSTGNFSMSGQTQIIIAPGASLMLYVGDISGSSVSASISGNGILNGTGVATNCCYYGLPSNTGLDYSGNASFIGGIYAPSADFRLNGGGNNTYDFIGASVTATVTFNGHFNFHYDEALGIRGPRRGFIILSWNEI